MGSLRLDFLSCGRVTSLGVKALAQALPGSLRELNLVFAKCPAVTNEGAACLADHIPQSVVLQSVRVRKTSASVKAPFSALFVETQVDRNFSSVDDIRKWRSRISCRT